MDGTKQTLAVPGTGTGTAAGAASGAGSTLQPAFTGVKLQRQGSGQKDPLAGRMAIQLSLVEYKNMKFLIFDAPSDRTLENYLKELEKYNVTDIVRVCDPTYDKTVLEAKGIAVHDWPFADGEAPPNNIVVDWLNLVNARFGVAGKEIKPAAKDPPKDPPVIGVHCVAGLGRAPVLVSMALIEGGMAPLDSVIYVRERRRGAINARQLKYIEAYKRRAKEKGCVVM